MLGAGVRSVPGRLNGWSDPLTLGGIVLGVVLLPVFVLIERSHRAPMLSPNTAAMMGTVPAYRRGCWRGRRWSARGSACCGRGGSERACGSADLERLLSLVARRREELETLERELHDRRDRVRAAETA